MQNNIRLKNILVIAIACTILLLASTRGYFSSLDNWLYDRLLPFTALFQQHRSQVLLIKCAPQKQYSAAVWNKLIVNLQEKGAKKIIFAFTPQHKPTVANAKMVVWGRHWEPNQQTLQPLTSSSTKRSDSTANDLPANDLPADLAIIAPLQPVAGVYRHARTTVIINGKNYPSVVGAIIPKADHDTDVIEVNFSAGQDTIPLIHIERVIEGDLITELVSGKTILIGIEHTPFAPKLTSPLGDRYPLTQLYFRGMAIDTILQNKAIQLLGNLKNGAVLLLLISLSILFYSSLNLFLSVAITAILILSYALVATILLGSLYWRLPLAEMIALQILIFGFMFAQKSRIHEQQLATMLLERSVHLHKRLVLPSFSQIEDHWAQIITLVNQTLKLRRAIFLEALPGIQKVKEIKALHCSLDDIHEMRRDYGRDPYQSAITQKVPIRLDRYFFKMKPDDEEQFLVALSYAGETLGFWAFGVHNHIENNSHFINAVTDYAKHIGQILRVSLRLDLDEKPSFLAGTCSATLHNTT